MTIARASILGIGMTLMLGFATAARAQQTVSAPLLSKDLPEFAGKEVVMSTVTYPAGGISHFRMWRDNLRISLAHTRLFFGMLASLPGRAMRGVHWARMAEAGYDPRGAVVLWRNMAEVGGARPPRWLSTHPDPASRLRELDARAASLLPVMEQARRAGRMPRCR